MTLARHWKIISFILIVLTILVFVVQKINNRARPLPDLVSLSEIAPGDTRVSQLQNLPTLYHQQPEGNNQKIYFGQNAPQQYTEITAKDGTVLAIKKTNPKEFEFTKLRDYASKYGQDSRNVQSGWDEFGFRGYVYASVGKIIIAHPQNGEVVEEWIVAKDVDQETINQLFPPKPTNQGN